MNMGAVFMFSRNLVSIVATNRFRCARNHVKLCMSVSVPEDAS